MKMLKTDKLYPLGVIKIYQIQNKTYFIKGVSTQKIILKLKNN